jgi:hypothetical protein
MDSVVEQASNIVIERQGGSHVVIMMLSSSSVKMTYPLRSYSATVPLVICHTRTLW